MLTELMWTDEFSRNSHKEIETIEKEPVRIEGYTEKKKKNTLDGINNRLDKAENQISNLEDEVLENTQSEEEKEKKI